VKCSIVEIYESTLKSQICETILRSLPDWFGIEESTAEYINGVAVKPFFCVYDDANNAIGFVSLLMHNEYTAEIYVMGVAPEQHHQGYGRKLIEAAVTYCKNHHMTFLTVKTLAESHPDPGYANTRKFYISMGFKPLEIFPTLWDECNPCLFMCMSL